MQRYVEWVVRFPRTIVGLAVLVTVVLALQVRDLEVIIDPSSNLPGDHPYVRVTRKIEELFGLKYVVIIGLTPTHGDAFSPNVLWKVQRIRQTSSLSPAAANRAAVVASITRIGPVMLTAGTVAALGFLSLAWFPILAIRTFGIFAGLGILSALAVEMTFTPALRSLLPAPRENERPQQHRPRLWDRVSRTKLDGDPAERWHVNHLRDGRGSRSGLCDLSHLSPERGARPWDGRSRGGSPLPHLTAGQAIRFVALAITSGYGVLILSYQFRAYLWFAIMIANTMHMPRCTGH